MTRQTDPELSIGNNLELLKAIEFSTSQAWIKEYTDSKQKL